MYMKTEPSYIEYMNKLIIFERRVKSIYRRERRKEKEKEER